MGIIGLLNEKRVFTLRKMTVKNVKQRRHFLRAKLWEHKTNCSGSPLWAGNLLSDRNKNVQYGWI
jgi:hypothetical protein